MTAYLVADLGFGDAGKGTVVDWLVRTTGARLVVRYNGGAQAGHNVVTSDGRHHTFAQFGAGSLAGAGTHLSRFMVVHPTGLLVEAQVLAGKGLSNPLETLTIDPAARIITPYHQSANRLREMLRGNNRHGSCGVGVGETVEDSLLYPEETVWAKDLADVSTLRRKLARVQDRKRAEFLALNLPAEAQAEMEIVLSREAGERWIEAAITLAGQVAEHPMPKNQDVVFEGAQGVLLDEWRGFHPYTTWSTCTFDNALELLEGWGGEVFRLGVLRSYATRHGAGPFPTEDLQLQFPEPHNATGPWQGGFRQGWLDAVLARYAIAACGGIDGLALTHMDRLCTKIATKYRGGEPTLGAFRDLEHQERLTHLLGEIEPIYMEVDDLAGAMAEHLGVPIWLTSWGPRAEDKRREAGRALG